MEDNDIARMMETRVIKQCDCDVDAASTGAQALDLISNHHYDLVLMDIGLPDTDGLELTKKIRSTEGENKTVPIVALTAHENTESQEKAIEVGMNSYIVKPLTLEKCKEAIKQYI